MTHPIHQSAPEKDIIQRTRAWVTGLWATGLLAIFASGCSDVHAEAPPPPSTFAVQKSDAAWRKLLSPVSYDVLRQRGTERAFSGAWHDEHRQGTYTCAGCGAVLYRSAHKFDSGTGWPSFFTSDSKESVVRIVDKSHGMVRTELVCARCGGHLGHVFDDGPKPTGERHCINSAALAFTPAPPAAQP